MKAKVFLQMAREVLHEHAPGPEGKQRVDCEGLHAVDPQQLLCGPHRLPEFCLGHADAQPLRLQVVAQRRDLVPVLVFVEAEA